MAMETTTTKQKVCTNCGGSEFYSHTVNFTGHTVQILPLGFWNPAECRVQVCGGCGLVQWFVKEHSLEAVRKKFEREG